MAAKQFYFPDEYDEKISQLLKLVHVPGDSERDMRSPNRSDNVLSRSKLIQYLIDEKLKELQSV